MDRLDYLILAEFEKDASLSFVDIAKSVGTTPYTVRRRYEKMKKDGIIFRTIVTIDLSKLGYQGKLFLLVHAAPNCNKTDTIAYLKNLENVLVVTEVIGPCDILAIAPITDLKSIQKLIEEAKKAPNIQRVEFACINDVDFPICRNFGAVLNTKSQSLAKT
jgi:DNA-binding Lrp family transcriptional regulator